MTSSPILTINITTDMAILDFSKAFDVMPHQRLLLKLDHYGIRSKTKNWISSFLTKRHQRVVVNGQTSDWTPVLSGAPQGTVLGPHLFLILINDIHENVNSTTRLFADDCLVYNTINSNVDEKQLQRDLDKMAKWAEKWGMIFNPSKCQTMRMCRNRIRDPANYSMLGTDLAEVGNSKYLGVILQNDLSWNMQTDHATKKSNQSIKFHQTELVSCCPVRQGTIIYNTY